MRLIIGFFCEKIPNFYSFLIFVANSDGVLFLGYCMNGKSWIKGGEYLCCAYRVDLILFDIVKGIVKRVLIRIIKVIC